MADGSHSFNFPLPQHSKLRDGEIVVDLFAGGGGASEALKQALGVDPALAYNHDEWAIGMHAANHPLTTHHREDIWHADPVRDVAGRKVGWFHFSPDCTHFSQAKGGQPRNHKIRALAWVGVKWVGQLARVGLAPRILSMENVWQMLSWCPLVAKRDKATGRVVKMDGTVAAVGERVPVQMQQLVPDKKRLGHTWNRFIAVLRALGYVVEWSKIDASDYGAGTQRQRLFLLARRDGEPIVWPAASHGPRTGQVPKVVAADSIDFSDLGRSIFDRPRPLADATLKRIAGGLVKHVLQAKEPFFLTEFANAGNGGRTWSSREPLRTQCAKVKGGHFALVAPTLVKFKGDSIGHPLTDPMPVITAGGACKRPAGAAHSLAVMAAHLESLGVANDDCMLSPEHEAGALRVASFLINYYGNGTSLNLREPLDTVTTRDRMALVTVVLDGERYVIVDITLRMLRPHELFKAQGFPDGYIIDRTADGRVITTSTAVRMVGNSVSPPPLCAIARANLDAANEPMRLAA